jgi:hypothetical protein
LNSYIQSNFATKEAADIVLVAGNIKLVLADKKSDEVESSAPDIAYAVVAVSSGKSAASEASTAVAVSDILSVQKKGVSVLTFFA